MEKEFVTYEIALQMKEIGYNERNIYHYANGILQEGITYNSDHRDYESISAPLYQQAFRWFREEYNLTWEHQFDDSNISLYVGEIAYPDNNLDFFKIIEVECDGYNKAYEQAQLECLKKLIQIVKERK